MVGKLMRSKEAIALLGVSRRRFYQLVRDGFLRRKGEDVGWKYGLYVQADVEDLARALSRPTRK